MPVRSHLRSYGPERFMTVTHYWSVVYENYVLHSTNIVRSGIESTSSTRTTSIHPTRATASNETRKLEHMRPEQSHRPTRSQQPPPIRPEVPVQEVAGQSQDGIGSALGDLDRSPDPK